MNTPRSLADRTLYAALLGSAWFVMPHAAQAQAGVSTLAACAALAADSERLACYDRLSGRGAAPAAVPPAGTAPPAASAAPTGVAPADKPAEEGGYKGLFPTLTTGGGGSMLTRAWSFDASSPRYVIDVYAPNYFLFGRYTTSLNTAPFDPFVDGGLFAAGTELDSTEAAFQLSFKFRLWTTDDRRWGAWAAYTQQSQWQLYNDSGNASRPFRETNYMPELILSYKPGLELGNLQWNLFSLAFNHQSNGRSDTISRSWNRIIAGFGVESGDVAVVGRLWWRIPEASDSDDNPTISDYYGWGDLLAIYKWRGNSFSGTLRGNPSTGKGAGQLAWTSAPFFGPLRGYVKLFSGYGETMIDYNWKQSTIGIGVTLNDWL
jgi:phospholipase A1/A2